MPNQQAPEAIARRIRERPVTPALRSPQRAAAAGLARTISDIFGVTPVERQIRAAGIVRERERQAPAGEAEKSAVGLLLGRALQQQQPNLTPAQRDQAVREQLEGATVPEIASITQAVSVFLRQDVRGLVLAGQQVTRLLGELRQEKAQLQTENSRLRATGVAGRPLDPRLQRQVAANEQRINALTGQIDSLRQTTGLLGIQIAPEMGVAAPGVIPPVRSGVSPAVTPTQPAPAPTDVERTRREFFQGL